VAAHRSKHYAAERLISLLNVKGLTGSSSPNRKALHKSAGRKSILKSQIEKKVLSGKSNSQQNDHEDDGQDINKEGDTVNDQRHDGILAVQLEHCFHRAVFRLTISAILLKNLYQTQPF
jgi:hypothetical protein